MAKDYGPIRYIKSDGRRIDLVDCRSGFVYARQAECVNLINLGSKFKILVSLNQMVSLQNRRS